MKTIPYGYHTIDAQDINNVTQALRSHLITQGPKIKEFEDALCRYTGAKYAVCVSSGTAALHIACLACGLKAGDEVITSPITFVATANSVLYCKAKPVFADIQEETVNIDPDEILKKLTKKTKAIILVHFAGHPCDLEEIKRIAQKYKLLVIEDAAHALGATYRDSMIGSCKFSDMTVFSFHPVKTITTGEGGAVLTNDKKIYEKLVSLRNHGITKEKNKFMYKINNDWYYEMHDLGYNYRITDFQCALGISQLKKIDSFLWQRRRLAGIYRHKLSHLKGIVLPVEKDYVKSSWHLYCIQLKDYKLRDTIFRKMRNSGIGVQVHYFPVYLQPYYRRNFGYKEKLCPKAENYSKRTLTLPLFSLIRNSQIRYVVEGLEKFLPLAM